MILVGSDFSFNELFQLMRFPLLLLYNFYDKYACMLVINLIFNLDFSFATLFINEITIHNEILFWK